MPYVSSSLPWLGLVTSSCSSMLDRDVEEGEARGESNGELHSLGAEEGVEESVRVLVLRWKGARGAGRAVVDMVGREWRVRERERVAERERGRRMQWTQTRRGSSGKGKDGGEGGEKRQGGVHGVSEGEEL